MSTDLPNIALAQMEVRAGRPVPNVESMLGFIGRACEHRPLTTPRTRWTEHYRVL